MKRSGSPLRAGWLQRPHPSRLAGDHPLRAMILARHDEALHRGASNYVDPASGYRVLTARFLAERGSCCDTGCRHCPFVGSAADHSGHDDPGSV